mgnify:CR=1 FL=1|tara:strand:- start:126 stop:614 length:489 start_codon:yes stop_codon:yes gene_type:complete
MERLIKKISTEIEIVFDDGKFDEWCVYVKDKKGKKPPLDIDYFEFFIKLGKKYSNEKVYMDFVKIYDLVTRKVEKRVLDLIVDIAKANYKEEDSKNVAINFIVIYAGMVAEKNKRFTVLKEKIKRLGMHQILMLNYSSVDAANFSRGKKAKDLEIICKKYGF